MLKKNEVYTAEMTGYTAEGMGVCRVDGQVVFVAGALCGEVAEVKILKVGKTQAFGKIERLITPSPHRVAPDCPDYKKCGGCALRHMDYAEELSMKAQRVHDALVRLGGAELGEIPIYGAENIENYRNKAIFPVAELDGRADAGFFRARSHDLVAVEHCRIQSPVADAARAAVVGWMRRYAVAPYDEETRRGLVRNIYVRNGAVSGETLVCLVVNGASVPHEKELVTALRESVAGLRAVVLNPNTRAGNAILGSEFIALWGDGAITDTLCGLDFRLSPRSFYQVNHAQAERLYALALEFAALGGGDTALDLYCGTGTITLCLAKRAGRVYGVEVIPAAIEDARENAKRNGITNAEFFCADASEAAARFARDGVKPQVIVVDPPRKGLAPDVVTAMLEMSPDRVVYVSCDPATLGRDVKLLQAGGYRAERATAVDLFPRCAHVETVVLLSKVG